MARTVGNTRGAKKRADRYFSLIVRSRGACEHCGQTAYLQTGHIISRRYSHTRCVEANALCLCAGCHHHFTDHPVDFAAVVMMKLGPKEYARLNLLSQQTGKVDWVQVAVELKARWEQIEAAA